MSERNPYNPGEDDGQMQKRTLIAFLLMGLVLFSMQYFLKPEPKPAAAKDVKKTEQVKAPGQAAVTAPAAAPAAPQAEGAPLTVAAHDEGKTVIETDLFHIVFSNRGGVVQQWTLKKFPDSSGKPLEVVNIAAADKVGYPFQYAYRGQEPPVKLNGALFVATASADGLGVTFDYSDKNVTAKKTFQFEKNSYLAKVTSDVHWGGAPVQHLLEWRGGFGDFAAQSASGLQHSIRFILTENKLKSEAAKEAKDHPVDRDGQFSFAGLEDRYFAAVFLPEGNGDIKTTLYDDYVPTQYNKEDEQYIGSAIGGEGYNRFELFVGPKDIELLRQINPKLEQIVDWGWFWILAKPLFLVMRWLNRTYVSNYGWSIVVITIGVNLLLFPLRFFSMRSMKKMQALQPKIAVINAKYKDMSLRDPRMAQKNEETMALYKENGVNPMAGCIPLLIQMPFLYAFYTVLGVSIQMRGASWLWVMDLSQPEHLSLRILPLILIGSSFLMQRMTPTTGMDPSQARMMMFMPLIMGFFFYNQSSGLVLYWLTGNVMGIAQQYFFNKTMAPAKPANTIVIKSSSAKNGVKKPVKR